MTATKEKFFNPVKLSAHDKAAATDHTARSIIAAELSAREKKTEKLKALRLQQAAEAQPETAVPVKKTRASSKTATKR
jgi:hypothetical protein